MKFYIVDCFAEEPYQGNQLLVVVQDRTLTDEEQQKITDEINFSETAFICSGKQENEGYDVTIRMPGIGEAPFAGHPTLGTAYVIQKFLEDGTSDRVILNLKVGQIPVVFNEDILTMSQKAPVFGDCVSKEEIAPVFHLEPEDIRDDYPIRHVSTGLPTVAVPLKSRKALKRVHTDPDLFQAYLKQHPNHFCTHFFFVQTGDRLLEARCMSEDYREDPATGSANGDLAGYLIRYRWFDSDDVSWTVIQGEDMGRKSVLQVHASHIHDEWTIEVGGKCHMIASGEWEI
ncbi:MAG: PhzF family phenazine biosynthesis protein [Erysipelotrichaceae bacterium]|nr:PhzF family phenazine biosynthesis protein [Erysipelotrichaceae bacterium]